MDDILMMMQLELNTHFNHFVLFFSVIAKETWSVFRQPYGFVG